MLIEMLDGRAGVRLWAGVGTSVPWLGMALAVLAGCADPSRADPHDEVIPWLEFPDTVELGGTQAEGPEAFGTIRAAAILDDEARLIVADGQTQELHLFSLSGQHLAQLAGRGGGPGEHRAIREVRATKDGGFCTWDVQTVRASRFDSDGRLVSTGTANLDHMESIRPAFQGFVQECGFVLRDQRSEMGMHDVPEGPRRDTVTFALFGADGAEIRQLVRRPGSLQWFRNRDRTWGHVTPIFGGELVAFTHGEELWVGNSSDFVWTRIGLDGDTVGTVGISQEPRVATDADIDAERARRVAEIKARRISVSIGPPDLMERMAEAEREGVRAVLAQDTIPAYDVVVPTLSGDFWLRRYPMPTESEATWVVLDSLARPVGQMTLPRGDSILDASPHAVLVSTQDDMDAPVLRILRR